MVIKEVFMFIKVFIIMLNRNIYIKTIHLSFNMELNKKIGFVGAGNMATALIKALLKANLVSHKNVFASDRNKQKLLKLKKQYKINVVFDNKELAKNVDIVFLAVKPQDINVVLKQIKKTVKNQLVVSIAAGITLTYLQRKLGKVRIIRVMPNIACLVGEMAAGFSLGKYATNQDKQIIKKILNAAGIGFEVKENLLDAITGLSGSGPAFFALVIDAMAKAGIKEGLSKDISYKLAIQTALGTAKLLSESNMTADEFIKTVASKGGTTEAGFKELKKGKVNNAFMKAVNKATKRSKQLGKK